MIAAKQIRFIFFLFVVGLLLGACTWPVATADFDVHFGRPVSGDVIMVGESMELVANGSSTDGDVVSVQFFADDRLIASKPNHYGGTIVTSYIWTPTEPGQYTMRLIAERRADFAYSPTITICVLPFQIAPGHVTDTYAHGYEGDCPVPVRSPSAIPGTPSLRWDVNPDSLTYVPDYVDLCPDQTRVVNVDAWVDDPHDDVAYVTFAFQVLPASHSRLNSEGTLVLTRAADSTIANKHFQGQLDLHIWLARSLETSPTDLTRIDGQVGTLNWTIRAFGRDGTILLTHGPETINATPVNCDGTPVTLSSSAPIVIGPSSTPATAKDCPAGTYFAEVTHRCIPIQIVTTKPGGDNGGDGGNSCSPPPGGCSKSEYWSTATCSCQVFQ